MVTLEMHTVRFSAQNTNKNLKYQNRFKVCNICHIKCIHLCGHQRGLNSKDKTILGLLCSCCKHYFVLVHSLLLWPLFLFMTDHTVALPKMLFGIYCRQIPELNLPFAIHALDSTSYWMSTAVNHSRYGKNKWIQMLWWTFTDCTQLQNFRSFPGLSFFLQYKFCHRSQTQKGDMCSRENQFGSRAVP